MGPSLWVYNSGQDLYPCRVAQRSCEVWLFNAYMVCESGEILMTIPQLIFWQVLLDYGEPGMLWMPILSLFAQSKCIVCIPLTKSGLFIEVAGLYHSCYFLLILSVVFM